MSWRKYHSEKNVNKKLSEPTNSDGSNETVKMTRLTAARARSAYISERGDCSL